MKLSDKAINCNESETVKYTPLINKLKREGKDIISFAVGEADINTPECIKEETINAIKNNKTKYSAVSGLISLKKIIAKKEKVKIKNIIITNGSKQGLYEVFQTILNKNDEVIIPVPYWVNYKEQIKFSEGKCIFSNTSNHQLNIKDIKNKITSKTKAIVINSPNNPSGAIYHKKDLEEIKKLSQKNKFYVIYDDAYEDLNYSGEKSNFVLDNNSISIKSFSKSFSMGGFRIGYVIASDEIIYNLNKIQSHITGNVNTFSQYGAIKSFEIYSDEIKKRKKIFQKKRDLAYSLCKEIFNCIKPHGAFYLFPEVSNKLKGQTVEEFTKMLLTKANVLVMPGTIFGMKKHIRISYTCSMNDIREGFSRIKKYLDSN
jgi:aspartate aminotransferase